MPVISQSPEEKREVMWVALLTNLNPAVAIGISQNWFSLWDSLFMQSGLAKNWQFSCLFLPHTETPPWPASQIHSLQMRAEASKIHFGFFKDSLAKPSFLKREGFLCFAWVLWPVSGCGLCRAGCGNPAPSSCWNLGALLCAAAIFPGLDVRRRRTFPLPQNTWCCRTRYNLSTSPKAFASLPAVKTGCMPGSSRGRASAFGVPGSVSYSWAALQFYPAQSDRG